MTLDLRIEIPEELSPIERGEKYDDPICDLLERHSAGFVFGGGTKLNPSGDFEFCYVDIRAEDAKKAKLLVSEYLLEIGAPPGTKIGGSLLRAK